MNAYGDALTKVNAHDRSKASPDRCGTKYPPQSTATLWWVQTTPVVRFLTYGPWPYVAGDMRPYIIVSLRERRAASVMCHQCLVDWSGDRFHSWCTVFFKIPIA